MNDVTRVVRHRLDGEVDRRVIEMVTGRGKKAVVKVLSTVIEKVKMEPKFVKNAKGSVQPVEQYGFKVGNLIGERFADAMAMVMDIHGVKISEEGLDQRQAYVQAAVAIQKSTRRLKLVPMLAVEIREENASGVSATAS